MDKKSITKEILDLQVLETLTNAYAEISSGRMKKTRDSVVLSREFLVEIQTIFKELQASYRREFLHLAKKKGEKITFLSHNGRKVALFLSSNTGLYGNLTKKVFRKFKSDLEKENMEATIVGKLGLSLYLETFPKGSYSYFELPDYGFDRDKMAELINHLVEYEEIHIYYGKFSTIINQDVDKIVISAESEIDKEDEKKHTKYLFEPSLVEILTFFETEMFSSVFEQVINESQLAKFASRMIAMDEAQEKVKQNLFQAKLEKSKLLHHLNNKKQIEYLSSVMHIRRFS